MLLLKTTSLKGSHCHHRLVDDFFQSVRIWGNDMYRAPMKLQFSKIDQENLSMKVDTWRKKKSRILSISDRMVMTKIYRAQSSCFSMKMVTKLVM